MTTSISSATLSPMLRIPAVVRVETNLVVDLVVCINAANNPPMSSTASRANPVTEMVLLKVAITMAELA